ncbi:hypothetical protein NECAME_08097 [Necator americanus]|uniref:Neurotransmitter-gated ion-channel transmembrane region n=1 Tax=Necator americanus TaxID=51031 RepID=W2TK44_NECAM|nr:hypothetical protein NECAME_08097 [Necator americanus]ETN82168.1 hypothetical protein NECAME_08097 [Necator americanus]
MASVCGAPPIKNALKIQTFTFKMYLPTFIFFSLIELAIVAYNDKMDDQRLKGFGIPLPNSNGNCSAIRRSVAEISVRKSKGSELGAAIDRAASIAFPVAFAMFNLAYWAYYLSSSSRTKL